MSDFESSEKVNSTTANGKLNGHSGNDSEEFRSYDYPEQFRKQIIALMLQSGWLATFPGIVRSEYFNLSEERRIVSSILDYHDEYRIAPSLGDMHFLLPDDKQLVFELVQLSQRNLEKTSDEVIEWAKDESMRIALIDSVKDYEDGEFRKIRSRISGAMLTGQNVVDVGLELLADVGDWMLPRMLSGIISIPWHHLNRRIDGGLGKGEIGVILGKSGGLKTTVLVNIGYWAAGIVNRQDVLHITLEMSENKILQRYAARTMLKPMHEFGGDAKKFEEQLFHNAMVKLEGKIRVKQFPTGQLTVGDLWDYLNLIRERDNFVPGMVIVDYPGLMRAENRYDDKRFEYDEIFVSLRAMAITLDIPIWTASQARRKSWSNWVLTSEDVAEHIGITNIADLIISTNRNSDEEKLNIIRLYAAKVREEKGGCHVKCRLQYPTIIESRKEPYVKSKGDE